MKEFKQFENPEFENPEFENPASSAGEAVGKILRSMSRSICPNCGNPMYGSRCDTCSG